MEFAKVVAGALILCLAGFTVALWATQLMQDFGEDAPPAQG